MTTNNSLTLADDILGLLALACVIQRGSFTAAGQHLGISKSAISERIARLESRLGVQVLQRTTRRLSLTGEGQQIYERALKIMQEAESALEVQGETPHGMLRLTAPATLGATHLTPTLSSFLQKYPRVSVQLSLTERVVDIVGEGIDLALRVAGRLQDSMLIARRLCSARTVCCASPDYLSRFGTPKHPVELLGRSCLHYNMISLEAEWSGLGVIPINPRFSADSGHALRHATLAGMGIAMVPSFMVHQDLKNGTLVELFPDPSRRSLNIYAVHAQTRVSSPALRALIEHLTESFREPDWA